MLSTSKCLPLIDKHVNKTKINIEKQTIGVRRGQTIINVSKHRILKMSTTDRIKHHA